MGGIDGERDAPHLVDYVHPEDRERIRAFTAREHL
jgi:hypothetical protein